MLRRRLLRTWREGMGGEERGERGVGVGCDAIIRRGTEYMYM